MEAILPLPIPGALYSQLYGFVNREFGNVPSVPEFVLEFIVPEFVPEFPRVARVPLGSGQTGLKSSTKYLLTYGHVLSIDCSVVPALRPGKAPHLG